MVEVGDPEQQGEVVPLSGHVLDRVPQQTGDRHRPDAARDRRDGAGDLDRLLEIDVADQSGLAGSPLGEPKLPSFVSPASYPAVPRWARSPPTEDRWTIDPPPVSIMCRAV